MINSSLAKKVLSAALKNGGEFGEIFLENTSSNHLLLMDSKIKTINNVVQRGAGIRVFANDRVFYASTSDLSEQGLLSCASMLSEAINSKKISFSIADKKTVLSLDNSYIYPNTVDTSKKIAILKNMANVACGRENIVQFIARYSDKTQNVCIINTEGKFIEDTRIYTRIFCNAVAEKNGLTQTAYAGPGASLGFEYFNNIDLESIVLNTTTLANNLLAAKPCPAGKMPVIIDNNFGGVIFHEACGHSLEASAVAYGKSEFAGKLGQQIASTCVTAVDDGGPEGLWGSIKIDDEGEETGKLVLIENGILKNYMIDKFHSKMMNMPATGSSRRQNYTYAPTSRMRNTYIAAGSDKFEDMVSSMGEGLYAKSLGGGSVNPETGEFNFNVSEGYIVKNGKIQDLVRGASLIGKGSDILMKIDMVSDCLAQDPGMCGSSSGSVPVTVGQPCIRVSEIVVGGEA